MCGNYDEPKRCYEVEFLAKIDLLDTVDFHDPDDQRALPFGPDLYRIPDDLSCDQPCAIGFVVSRLAGLVAWGPAGFIKAACAIKKPWPKGAGLIQFM